MYQVMLLLHSYTRWLVLIAMVLATIWAWWGLLSRRAWTVWDRRFGAAFAILFTIQFVWGTFLFFLPNGIAQVAWRDIGASMEVRELRFFSVEHPFQMIIALGVVHLGWTRSRKATLNTTKFRWAVTTYTVAILLIVSVIPWWRPLFRTVVSLDSDSNDTTEITIQTEGDASRGEALFAESINGQPACTTCHALDDTRLVGPGMAGMGERASDRVEGQSAEDYLLESIVSPGAYVVEGFPNVMPGTYNRVLDEQQMADLVAYLLQK